MTSTPTRPSTTSTMLPSDALPGGDAVAARRASAPADLYRFEDVLSPEERAVRDRVRAWCDEAVLPVANDYWQRAQFPAELVPGYGRLGVAGGALTGPGCPGMSALAEGLVAAEFARADGSISTFNVVHSGLAMASIGLLGAQEQQERWLPAMARADKLGAFALTEPDHGSDVVRLETRARRDGDSYVLHGAKRWIGNGSVADLVVVWARDDDGDVGGFVVEHGPEGTPGYEAAVITGKSGNRAVWQAEIALDGVRVPADNRLAHARTFADTAKVLTKSRQSVAWEGLGHATAAYEAAVAYVAQRRQFGKPLASFQLVQNKLSSMLSDIVGMQFLCLRMAQLQQEGRAELPTAALGKLHTASAARRVLADARDLLGGNGLLLDYHVARHHADMEAVYTYEGTDTVQSLIVGREITGISAFA